MTQRLPLGIFESNTPTNTHELRKVSQANKGEPLSPLSPNEPRGPFAELYTFSVALTKLQSEIDGLPTVPPVRY